MPFTMFAFLVGSLSIIGLPPFAGAWSKWYLVLGAMHTGQFFVVGVLIISSLLNIAYLLPIVVNAFFAPLAAAEAEVGLKEAPLACVIPLLLTATGCLVLFIYSDPLLDLVRLIGVF